MAAKKEETKKEQILAQDGMDVKETQVTSDAEPAEKKDDGRVDYLLPMHILGDEEVVEACLNGKVYQVRCGETVRIPKGLAELLDHSIAQTKKVNALKRERENGAREIKQ